MLLTWLKNDFCQISRIFSSVGSKPENESVESLSDPVLMLYIFQFKLFVSLIWLAAYTANTCAYLSIGKTNLVHKQSPLFWHFINTTAYNLGWYKPLSPFIAIPALVFHCSSLGADKGHTHILTPFHFGNFFLDPRNLVLHNFKFRPQLPKMGKFQEVNFPESCIVNWVRTWEVISRKRLSWKMDLYEWITKMFLELEDPDFLQKSERRDFLFGWLGHRKMSF